MFHDDPLSILHMNCRPLMILDRDVVETDIPYVTEEEATIVHFADARHHGRNSRNCILRHGNINMVERNFGNVLLGKAV
ncbi:hypothetical protein D3C73_1303700 [compost metagenome]